MKKRILCALLSAAMLFTGSPVVFAAETQPVKEQQTKETLPFTIKEANNDIKDESVKGGMFRSRTRKMQRLLQIIRDWLLCVQRRHSTMTMFI